MRLGLRGRIGTTAAHGRGDDLVVSRVCDEPTRIHASRTGEGGAGTEGGSEHGATVTRD